jgi:hypothetical protein
MPAFSLPLVTISLMSELFDFLLNSSGAKRIGATFTLKTRECNQRASGMSVYLASET